MLKKSFSFRARGTPVLGGLRNLRPVISPCANFPMCFLSGTGKGIAAGHVGKNLQFPRTRHSRDRIAERAIRGGGVEICAVIIAAPTRAFCRASQLSSKKDCGGPYWKKASVSARGDRIAERAIRGGG